MLLKASFFYASNNVQHNFTTHLTIDILSRSSSELKKQQTNKNTEQAITKNILNEKQNTKALEPSESKAQKHKQKIKPIKQTSSLFYEKNRTPPTTLNKTITKSQNPENKEHNQPSSFVYEEILEQAVQIDQAMEREKTFLREDFKVFSNDLREKLEKSNEKKQQHKEYLSNEQLKEGNEYFEYNATNGSKMIRIDGNCFEVPQDDPFDLVPKTWKLMGNCSKNKEFKFKAKTLSKQFQEKLKK